MTTEQAHEWERRAIILLGGGLAYIVTIAIIVLAFRAENEGERNLLIGGLLSSPVFGAAALFALLGISRQMAPSGRSLNVNVDPPSEVTVKGDVPQGGDTRVSVAPMGGANVGPVAATPVQSTSRGLQGRHVTSGPVPTIQSEEAEGGEDQRGTPGA